MVDWQLFEGARCADSWSVLDAVTSCPRVSSACRSQLSQLPLMTTRLMRFDSILFAGVTVPAAEVLAALVALKPEHKKVLESLFKAALEGSRPLAGNLVVVQIASAAVAFQVRPNSTTSGPN